ncbi:MAG: hypothetical protein B6241_10080 [Spirochaetaceae bacterium 4572_59]|nr:MAG: hypothetical protein B6241_10080 [Spirochaetaceae bacterium 4572_59]
MYHKRNLSGWTLFFSLLMAELFTGCAAMPPVEEEISMPLWMTESGKDSQAYSGIGAASGYDEAAGIAAENNARKDMAAIIAKDESMRLAEQLKAQGQYIQGENLFGTVRDSLLPLIADVEPAGIWISPEKESWAFLSIQRQDWDRMRAADRRTSVPVPTGLEQFSGMNSSILGILNEMNLPLQLIPGGSHTPYRLQLDWFVTDQLDNSLQISATLSFEQYGVLLDKRLYGPILVSGKTLADAREEGAALILDLLYNDQDFPLMVKKLTVK